jgi:tetratricopeptide (TPR) repeat protein
MATIAEALELARQYHRAGALPQAEELYRRILQVQPGLAEAHCYLGNALLEQGRAADATASYREAVRLQPDYAAAHNNLGTALRLQGRLDEALAGFERALRLDPGYPTAHHNRAGVLRDLGRLAEAVAGYEQALRLRPGWAVAQTNLGNVLREQRKLEDAVACLEQAVRLDAGYAAAHRGLGHALRDAGRPAKAAASYERALHLRPDDADAQNGLGVALREQGQLGEAVAAFERALRLDPQLPDARLNRAQEWLRLGRFAEGWPEYEWRWRQPHLPPRPSGRPAWDGSPPAGRTVLLFAEQGLGDTFQFVRYAALVKRRGGTVVLACQPPLVPLLTGCPGIDRLVAIGSPLPPFDVQAPLLSVPGLLGTTVDSIPRDVPYLAPAPSLVEHWRRELSSVGGFRVGIAWQGNPAYPADRQRSVPLAHFTRLARLDGVTLVSLQKGPGTEQLSALADPCPVVDLGGRLDDASGAFMDTAAVMTSLDLVITSDTAVPHLAGALAVPTWLALPLVPDWRWLIEREDSPWYPTMRLFRQREGGNWDEVFGRIAEALRRKLAAPGEKRPGG